MERSPLQGRFGSAAPRGQHQICKHLLWDLNWIREGKRCQLLEHLPIEMGKCISHFIMDPREVVSRKGKVKACCRHEKRTHKTHNAGNLGHAGVEDVNNRLVIRTEEYVRPRPLEAPNMSSN